MKKLTASQAVEAVARYVAGDSLAKLALAYGVSRQGMWDLLRRRTVMRSKLRRGAGNHFHRGGVRADQRAQGTVEKVIASGLLVRSEACSVCSASGTMADGRPIVQAHHDDYNYPLRIRWLCQRCHHEWHRTHRAVARLPRPVEAP